MFFPPFFSPIYPFPPISQLFLIIQQLPINKDVSNHVPPRHMKPATTSLPTGAHATFDLLSENHEFESW